MQRYAERPAFHCFGHMLTYADTDRLSRQFAAYLQRKLGVKKGDRIAVMLPNIAAFPLAFLGIIRAGAVQVNVNPLYTPRELEHQLNDAGAETIIVFNGVSATLAEIIGKTAVKQVISVAPGDGIGAALPGPAVDGRLTSLITFSDALAQGAKLPFTPVALCGDDLLFLQYTGGTTGALEGRRALAPQPGRQYRAVQSVHGRSRAARRGGRGHRVAALSHFRADGEFHLLLLDRRRELAGRQCARPRQLHRNPAAGAPHRLDWREHALWRICSCIRTSARSISADCG